MLSVHMETSCWYCHDGGSKTSIKITSWWFWSQGKYKPSFYDHKWGCCQGLDRDNYYICGVCGNAAQCWPAHNCSQPPALRPCPRTQRGPAARSAAALGTPQPNNNFTSPHEELRLERSSTGLVGLAGLGEFDTTSTTHCQIIAGGGLGKLTQFTDLQIFILFTVIGSSLAPILYNCTFDRQWTWSLQMGWEGCGLTSDWRRWWSRGRRARAAPAPGHPPRTRPSSSPRLSRRSSAGWDLDKIHGCMVLFHSTYSFQK